MTTRTTRSLLFAVPLSIWLLLVGVTTGLSADGSPPVGGLFACAVGLAITSSAVAIALWARGDAKVHVTAELQEVRVNLSHDLATFYQMMSRRIDSLEAPTMPLPRLAAVGTAVVMPAPGPAPMDPKVIEIGERIARRMTDGRAPDMRHDP